MKRTRKIIAILLAMVMMLAVMVMSAGADPTSDDDIEVNFLGEKTIQLKGLSEDLVDPVANVYSEQPASDSDSYLVSYLARKVSVVDGIIVGNTKRILEDETEYIVEIVDRETDYEIEFTFYYEVKVEQFDDVTYPCWYSDVLNYCVKRGYLSGVGNNKFAPDRAVTRAQVAQVLYAMSDKPVLSGSNNFSDVPDNMWYSGAVNWAAETKIMSGYTTGEFKPDAAITRQQFMATLYKYAKFMNYDTTRTGSVAEFSDASNITDYALASIEWALGHKLMTGTDKHLLLPKGVTTRAQLAVILAAFDKNIVGTENPQEEEPVIVTPSPSPSQEVIIVTPQPTESDSQDGRLIIDDDEEDDAEEE